MSPQITFYKLENDLRRAKEHVKQSKELWEADMSERNYVAWSVYQGIVDRLENRIEGLR